MKELDLYKFITKTNSEYHWIAKDDPRQENLAEEEKNEVRDFVREEHKYPDITNEYNLK